MRTLKGLVIHRTEVPSAYDSYHYVILRNGPISQRHPDEFVAQHSKDFNGVSIGIALFGDFCPVERSRNVLPTLPQLLALVRLCVELRKTHPELREGWIKGHTELGPGGTRVPEKLLPEHACPGSNLNLDWLRRAVLDLEKTAAYAVLPQQTV